MYATPENPSITRDLGALVGDGAAEDEHAKRRHDAQHDGDGLPQLDSAREGRAAQEERRGQGQLDAVGLPVVDAVPAEAVCVSVSIGSLVASGARAEPRGVAWDSQRRPTVQPATAEGTEPVLA